MTLYRLRLLLLLGIVLTLIVSTFVLPQSTLAVNNPPAGSATFASQANNLPVDEVIGGIGGSIFSLASEGNLLYVVEGVNLSIFDVSSPDRPTLRTRFLLPSDGKQIQILGNFAYIISNAGLHILDISSATTPVLKSTFEIIAAQNLEVSNNLAYIVSNTSNPCCRKDGLYIVDVSDPQKPSLRSHYEIKQVYNMVIAGNFIYLIHYHRFFPGQMVTILNISEPNQPILYKSYNVQGLFPDFSTVIDFHIRNSLGYAILSNEKEKRFVILDVSNPDHFIFLYLHPLVEYREPTRIAVIDNRAYLVYNNPASYGSDRALVMRMEIFDISSSTSPILLSSYEGVGPNHTTLIAAIGEWVYVAYCTWWKSCLVEIINVHDVAHPILAGKIHTLGGVHKLKVVANEAYIAAVDGLYIVDVSNPLLPQLLSSYPITQVYELDVVNNLAYVTTAQNLLEIIDVSNSLSPSWLSNYQHYSPPASAIRVANQTAYVGNNFSQYSLQLIDVSNPFSPTLRGSVHAIDGGLTGIDVIGSLAYMTEAGTETGVVQIIDVSNSDQPILRGTYATPGPARDIEVVDHIAYVSYDIMTPSPFIQQAGSGLQILDVRDPSNPLLQGSYIISQQLNSSVTNVQVEGNLVYVNKHGYPGASIEVIDASNPMSPAQRGTIVRPSAQIYDVQAVDDLIYLVVDGRIEILRIHPERFLHPIYLPLISAPSGN